MTRREDAKQLPNVRIDEGFYDTEISNVPVDIVSQTLSATTVEFMHTGDTHGLSTTQLRHQLFKSRSHGTVSIAAGLTPRLRNRLIEGGYDVQESDRRRQLFRCQLRATTLTRAAMAIVAIYEHTYRPRCNRVLVVKANSRSARSLARRIRKTKIECPVITDDSRQKGYRHYIRLVTTSLFSMVDRLSWDVVVFCGVDTVFCQDTQYGLSKCRNWPISFCCLRDESHLTDYEELKLESICGPILSDSLPHGLQKPHVTVLMIPAPGTVQPRIMCPFTRRKRCIWANEARNQLIARLAQSPEDALPGLGASGRTTVSVLVETLQHARQLTAVLPPEWATASCLPDREGIFDDTPAGNQCIVTTERARDTGINTNLVIRATGGSGPVDIHAEGGDRPQLIVDFLDQGSHLRYDTDARIKHYRARGWKVSEVALSK